MNRRPPSIFVCYAHEDGEVFLHARDEEFSPGSHTIAGPLTAKGNGFIPELWASLRDGCNPRTSMFWDKQIPGGAEWEKRIRVETCNCNVCLILVTPGFAGSVHVALHELPLIRQLHLENRMVVIPIYLGAIDWNRASHLNWLLNIQVLPDPTHPLDLTSNQQIAKVRDGITRSLNQWSPSFLELLLGWFKRPWIRPAALLVASFVVGALAGWFLVCRAVRTIPWPTSPQTQSPNPSAKPQIELVSLPPNSATGGSETEGEISGTVSGIDPTSCVVVIYSKTNMWWVQPLAESVIPIDSDGRWKASIHLGEHYAALLADTGYKPQSPLQVLPTVGGPVLAIQIK